MAYEDGSVFRNVSAENSDVADAMQCNV